ncbi:hypothetical protein UPYG_G00025430 [Umbra pygmaea]|uniref:Uncharacterized protein n=1 Tax=Umbra pygmaea TaxID=75934 RepID=A0ABD0XLT6_UMBPY
MKFGSIHRILLSLFLCRAADFTSREDSHIVKVKVRCPDLNGKQKEEIKYSLNFEEDEVVSHKYDSVYGHNATEIISKGWSLQLNETNHKVNYVHSGMTAERTGFYTCKATQMYPPPLLTTSQHTFLLVVDMCPSEEPPKCRVDGVYFWVWKLGFWITLAYGMAATIIGLVCYLRKKRGEGSHSDYMNTRPRAPPVVLKKKQGVQYPVRMGHY